MVTCDEEAKDKDSTIDKRFKLVKKEKTFQESRKPSNFAIKSYKNLYYIYFYIYVYIRISYYKYEPLTINGGI